MAAVKFNQSYAGYDPATIFEVDKTTKTLSPYSSGEAYTGKGYKFGQESVVKDNAIYGGYRIGAPINAAIANTPQSPNIPVNQVGATQPVTLPPPPPVDPGTGVVDGSKATTKTIEDYTKTLDVPATDAQKKQKELLTEVEGLIGKTAGKKEAQAAEEARLGVDTQKKALADLNAQILSRSAAYDAYINEVSSSAQESGTMGMVRMTRRQQRTANEKAVEIGMLNARALGLAGQVQAGMDAATRAVDLKYAPVEDQLKIKLAQLEAIQPLLNADEKKVAMATQLWLLDQERVLEEEKSKAKANLTLAVQQGVTTRYANRGGEIYDTLTGVGIPSEDAFRKLTGFTVAEAYKMNMITNIKQVNPDRKTETITANGKVLLIDTQTGEVLKDFGGAYKTGSGSGGGGPGPTKVTVANASDAVRTKWSAEGYIQGNGKISSNDYKAAKAWWVQQGLSSATFDTQFTDLIDQSSPDWKKHYGYKGN